MRVLISILNRPIRFSPLLIILLFAAGCKKSSSDNNPILPAVTYFDVSYGNHFYKTMDLYLPAGRDQKTTRLLILIHGGSWSFGDKTDLNKYVQLAREYLPGYAIANINYRLADLTNNKFPAQEDDVKSCIKYLKQHAEYYNISNQFILFGESAGAHLALLQAYKHKDIINPIALVDFYGPSDLKEMYNTTRNPLVREALTSLLNGTPGSNAAGYDAASPLRFATSEVCPTIIFHGGRDDLVDTTQSIILRNRLNELHVATEYVYYPNEGHGWSNESLKNSFDRIRTFLAENVQ